MKFVDIFSFLFVKTIWISFITMIPNFLNINSNNNFTSLNFDCFCFYFNCACILSLNASHLCSNKRAMLIKKLNSNNMILVVLYLNFPNDLIFANFTFLHWVSFAFGILLSGNSICPIESQAFQKPITIPFSTFDVI